MKNLILIILLLPFYSISQIVVKPVPACFGSPEYGRIYSRQSLPVITNVHTYTFTVNNNQSAIIPTVSEIKQDTTLWINTKINKGKTIEELQKILKPPQIK